MCLFITAVLPKCADLAALADVAARHDRCLLPIRNDSVQARLQPGDHYCRTTPGHCDCDSALGSMARRTTPDPETRARQLRRKGWSEAKIARALAQSTDAAVSPTALGRWQAFLAELLGECGLPRIGLILRMYSGDLDEAFELGATLRHRLSDLGPERLARLEHDVLHEVRP